MISKTQISIVIFWCRRIADRWNQQYLTRWKRGVAEDERKSKQRHQSRHSAAKDRGPFQATSRGGDKEGRRINETNNINRLMTKKNFGSSSWQTRCHYFIFSIGIFQNATAARQGWPRSTKTIRSRSRHFWIKDCASIVGMEGGTEFLGNSSRQSRPDPHPCTRLGPHCHRLDHDQLFSFVSKSSCSPYFSSSFSYIL